MSRPLTVVVEKSPDSDYGAWDPELPGASLWARPTKKPSSA
jgi:hypothetical protein